MLISCVLGAVDETISLTKTIDEISKISIPSVSIEVLLILAPFASQDCLSTSTFVANKYSIVKLVMQKNQGVGGAYRQGIEIAQGDYIVLMSSDLETDPSLVEVLVTKVIKEPEVDVICVSRWLEKGSFKGYSPILKLLNYFFQLFVQILYRSRLTDFTYAFRIYKKSVLKHSNWTENSHSFFLESILSFIGKGFIIHEIPGTWSARIEGERHIKKLTYFDYIRTAIQIRFSL